MQQPEPSANILIIRPSALGDVCRTVPVLASLRAAHPDARIEWLVRDSFADAVRAHPDLDAVRPFPRSRFAPWWRPSVAAEVVRWVAALRGAGYDLVVDCQGLGRSGAMALCTGAPRRVGLRTAREFGWLGYNLVQRPPPGAHTVDQMLGLVERLGIVPVRCMRLHAPPEDRAWWEGFDAGRYAVLAPTSRWASKRWPAPRWRDLIEPILQRGFERVVLIAAPGEEEQVAAIDPDPPAAGRCMNLAGRTSVGQTMAVVERAGLVIANDSAPLHMAVGFDRPCVGLFGPTDPRRVGPYRRPEAVIRAELHPREERLGFKRLGEEVMTRIGVAEVLERADRVVAPAAHCAEPARERR
jgi:lipopolysaccharide heptosyltransferase I